MENKIIRKVFLENLPRWESGKYKGWIKWRECVGKYVDFVYDTIVDKVLISDYVEIKNKKYLIFIYKDKEKYMTTNTFSACNFGNLLGLQTSEFKIEIGTIMKDDKRDIIITDRKRIREENGRWMKWYKINCKKCGFDSKEHWDISNQCYKTEYWINEYNLMHGYGCPCCKKSPTIVVKGINDIWTTNYKVALLLNDPEDGYKYTSKSGKKTYFKCFECNGVQLKEIRMVTEQGFGCEFCSDGLSYGHKFIFEMLNQLNLIYKQNFIPSWCTFNYNGKTKRGEYDFILENEKLIIEVDGGFHRENNSMNRQTKEASKEIDILKDISAKENGYNVIRIIYNDDKDLNNFKQNIIESDLFDLKDISWEDCHKNGLKSIIKYVCDYKNKNSEKVQLKLE